MSIFVSACPYGAFEHLADGLFRNFEMSSNARIVMSLLAHFKSDFVINLAQRMLRAVRSAPHSNSVRVVSFRSCPFQIFNFVVFAVSVDVVNNFVFCRRSNKSCGNKPMNFYCMLVSIFSQSYNLITFYKALINNAWSYAHASKITNLVKPLPFVERNIFPNFFGYLKPPSFAANVGGNCFPCP